jgi:hypothetical protein
MSLQCCLTTAGYQVVFHMTRAQRRGDSLDVVVELSVCPELGRFTVKSVPNFVSVADMRRLVHYLEEHISRLIEDASHESVPFVPLELGFQVQALAGDVGSENEGDFTLRFLVNIGRSPVDGTGVYVGAESVIEVENVRAFAASLEALLPANVATR